MRFQCNYFKVFAFFVLFSLSHVRFRYSMRAAVAKLEILLFLTFFLVRIDSSLLFCYSFLGSETLTVQKYTRKHAAVNSICIFLQSRQILENGVGQNLMFNRSTIQINLKRTESKVNRCKQNEYENRDKKKSQQATRDVLFTNMFTLFIFSFAFLVLDAPLPSLFVVVVGVP